MKNIFYVSYIFKSYYTFWFYLYNLLKIRKLELILWNYKNNNLTSFENELFTVFDELRNDKSNVFLKLYKYYKKSFHVMLEH